jgi:hypothetical protein
MQMAIAVPTGHHPPHSVFIVQLTGPPINLLVFLSFFLYIISFLFPFEDRPVFPETTKPNIPPAFIQRIFFPGNSGYSP